MWAIGLSVSGADWPIINCEKIESKNRNYQCNRYVRLHHMEDSMAVCSPTPPRAPMSTEGAYGNPPVRDSEGKVMHTCGGMLAGATRLSGG